jgi:hypothetical protein
MAACTSFFDDKGRECTRCLVYKSWDCFWKDWDGKNGKSSKCKECRKKIRPIERPDIKRNSSYKLNYGITIKDYNNIFEAQKGRCNICFKHASEFNRSLAVDHCHLSGKIRGLLCMNCNHLLGKAKDSIDILNNAIQYLKESSNV